VPAVVAKFRQPKAKSPKTTWRVGSLTVFVRDGHYHARGTVRHAGLRRRVRASLELRFSRENLESALAAARALEERIRGELGGDVKPLSVAEVALGFMTRPKDRPIGPTDAAVIKDVVRKFGTRILRDVSPAEFITFVDDRKKGSASSGRERYLSVVHAFLNSAIRKGQYQRMPAFNRDKAARNPTKRARRKVANVRPYLISLILEQSHVTIATQLVTEAATGARVSSVLFGCCLDDLVMSPNAMTLTFHDTKNGDDVPAALPESARPFLEDYLSWRELQVRAGQVSPAGDAPLFLTPRGRPYKPNRGYTGTRNKTGFNAAKRRAIAVLKVRGAETIAAFETVGDVAGARQARKMLAEDLAILQQFTQHWLRHKLATDLGRIDLRAAMRQGGWRDVRSVQGYLRDDPEFQRAAVEGRVLFDTNLTREEPSDDPK